MGVNSNPVPNGSFLFFFFLITWENNVCFSNKKVCGVKNKKKNKTILVNN
jgi:hypothetical protein